MKLSGGDDERDQERAEEQQVCARDQLERKRRGAVCDGDGATSAHNADVSWQFSPNR